MSDLKTCRFCGMSNYEHNHPAERSAWIRYGTRANAHLKCAVDRKGEAFIRALPTHTLECLPIFEMRDLGMFQIMIDELLKRGALTDAQARSWGGRKY